MMATKMKKETKLIQMVKKTNVKTRKMSMTPRTISTTKERRQTRMRKTKKMKKSKRMKVMILLSI